MCATGSQKAVKAEVVPAGSSTSCPALVREIVGTVLRHDSVTFAVVSSIAIPAATRVPSEEDRPAATALRDAAQATGQRFLDHVVVTGRGWRSDAA